MLDLVAPGRVIGVEQQLVREFRVPRLGQLFQQVRRSQKARTEEAVVGLDLGNQFVRGRGAKILGQQVHVQRQNVAGLGVAALCFGVGIVDLAKGRGAVIRAGNKAVIVYKLPLQGRANLLELASVLRFVRGTTRGLCHLAHQRYVVSPVGGSDQDVVGFAFRGEPVA